MAALSRGCKPRMATFLILLVSEHFNQADHSIIVVLLIPPELIRSNRDSVRKAREAHLIDKAITLEPRDINRRDEFNQWHLCF